MNNSIKNGLVIFIFAILLLPLLEYDFSFIRSGELHGEFTVAPDIDFSWKNWFDGTYRDAKGKYNNDHIGFRPDMIRLNNELDYSFFRKIHSEWRLLGNDNCIFQDAYIYSYLGKDYDGYPVIREKVRKLKAIQDTLEKLGKSLGFIQAPCKAFYYPEYFPAEFKDMPKGVNNFETYKRIADSAGLNQVDFNTWFVSMKHTSKELLFAKQGFHWTVYGSLLAADSLAKYLERQRRIHMIHPVWNNIIHTGTARSTDDDVARSMNLIFPLAKETFSYPEVNYQGDKTAVKPSVIFVGDSFLFQWLNEGVLENTFSSWQIWYYNMFLINKDCKLASKCSLENYNRIDEIDKTDCIVILYTSRNLSNMGRDFIEKTYAHYYPGK